MKKAYTLSEVLVVLLVLGIIAAFIIPAVMRTAPDRASLLYKKTFYSLQEASQKLINDEKLYPEVPTAQDEATRYGFFSGTPADPKYTDYSIYLCENLARTLNTVGSIQCEQAGSDGAPNFVTTNGVRWWNIGGNSRFQNGDNVLGANYIDISVQCNGTNFNIRIFEDGRVGTGPAGGQLNIQNNNIQNGQQGGDAYVEENRILSNPFKFRDL